MSKIQILNKVSKKYFKRAVDRNYFKRVLRECYRLNQNILKENINKPYAFMFFYQTKEKLSYQEIEEKTIQLFQKFNETIK
jgi:ribonuclease P protein component